MNRLDLYKARIVQEKALVPGAAMIDGRSEQDQLNFLVHFASLVNFYNLKNETHDSWMPFLLKDPIFLMAFISKTNFSKIHKRYFNTITNLQSLLNDDRSKPFTDALNSLFDQFIEIFARIEQWTHNMVKYEHDYKLRTYTVHHVKNNYSKYLWAIISLRNDLSLNSSLKGIELEKHEPFVFYNKSIWQENKDLSPYWKIFNLSGRVTKKTSFKNDIFPSLSAFGDTLFSFFDQVITYASVELKTINLQRCQFPDTLLLRVFINLMKIHQDQLNLLSKAHLNFYYEDILLQKRRPAVSDRAYVYALLAKNNITVNIPEGTIFNAGLDTKKKPILFKSIKPSNLNSAKILNAYTIARIHNSDHTSLYLDHIENPAKLKKDTEGKLMHWNTFGGTFNTTESQVSIGFSFASPMLLLREGKRIIELTLVFENPINQSLFGKSNASYYLSTQKAWEDVSTMVKVSRGKVFVSNKLILTITLPPSTKSIETFKKNPDGLNSQWPMFKMEFNVFPDIDTGVIYHGLAHPPSLKQLDITVTVFDVRRFKLYNNHGMLSTKAPFQLFGPVVKLHDHFIIGSEELFSKPIQDLSIELEWANLPDDFQDYYKQYNAFLKHDYDKPYPPPTRLGKKIGNMVSGFFEKGSDPEIPFQFTNTVFKVAFQVFQNSVWTPLKMGKKSTCFEDEDTNRIYCKPYTKCKTGSKQGKEQSDDLLLFSPGGKKCILNNKKGKSYQSTFAYEKSGDEAVFMADPFLQDDELKFTDKSSSGFIRMELEAPDAGFGGAMYSRVVSAAAMRNAEIISKSDGKTILALIDPPNLPFSPKVKSFTANYSASQSYNFDAGSENNPIQCFHYSPFKNYPVYDSNSKPKGPFIDLKLPTLFNRYDYNGALFLQLENVVAPGELNLFFELARNNDEYYPDDNIKRPIVEYAYLCTEGWQNFDVTFDGTNNFSCSGIITFNVSEDISTQNLTMPTNTFWLKISVYKDVEAFAKTVMIRNNGIEVERSLNPETDNNTCLKLKSNTINGLHKAIGEVSNFVQPFPSFGGLSEETEVLMNERVSARLKTKGRVSSPEDFFSSIKQAFNTIYYSKTFYDRKTKRTEVLVIEHYEDWSAPNAFKPLIDTCKALRIEQYLIERASPFANIKVANFEFEYVTIDTTISILPEFMNKGLKQIINRKLNIFLSPWIASDGKQIAIDQGLTAAEVANFIESIDGVLKVKSIYFLSPVNEEYNDHKTVPYGADSKFLLVSCMNHEITIAQ